MCPFAVWAKPYFASGKTTELERAVKKFSKTRGKTPTCVLVVLGPDSVPDIENWAIETFLALYVTFWVIGGIERSKAVDYVQRTVEPSMRDDNDPYRHFLTALQPEPQPLHAICMAPMYPKGHPRWAPHPVIVVTWGSDVARAQRNLKLVQQIRNKAFSAHGSKYDADALFLTPGSGTKDG